LPNTTVRAVNQLSDEIFELVLRRGEIQFEPGASFAIYHPRRVSRPYSPCSGQADDDLRFVIHRVPGGKVSGWLADLRPGDEVRLSEPFGCFRPGDLIPGEEPPVFIATGTGITPFLSALHSVPNLRPAACLYGVRRLVNAVEVDFLVQRCPLWLCTSREACPPHHHGRVTDLLDRLPRRPKTRYFLCGLDRMIEQVSAWLRSRGVEPGQIHREVFFRA